MYIASIRITNFKCFRGEHEIVLQPGVYAISAHLDTDQQRSNGLGKSSFVQAFVWVMTDEHGEELIDDLITRGEGTVIVELEMSDGTYVAKAKSRGKSGTLEVTTTTDGEERTIIGPAAQRYIDEKLVSQPLFRTVNYIEQKKVDAFAKIKDSDLIKMLTNWFSLDKVEAACAFASERLSRLSERERDLRQRITDYQGDADEEYYEEHIEAAEIRAAEARAARDALTDKRSAVADWKLREQKIAKRQRLAEQLLALKASAPPDVDEAELEAAFEQASSDHFALQRANEKLRELGVVAKGKFDGRCPVADIQCPAKREINSDREASKTRHDAAKAIADEAKSASDKAAAQSRTLKAARDARTRHDREVAALEAKLVAEGPELKATPEPESCDVAYDRLDEAATEAAAEAHHLRKELAKRRVDKIHHDDRVQQLAETVIAMRPWREAVEILGRNGAQRMIAEARMAEIIDNANAALDNVGSGLRVDVRWDREGQQLADTCDHCGAAFPASARVKTCQRCETPRGQKKAFKPRIRFNRVSGGLLDMGGAVLQVAAGAWLRDEYAVAFNVLFVDEPLGALDGPNARALGLQLFGMMNTTFGYEQSFMIAHTRDVVESAPHRIVIRSDGENSRIEVAA